MSEGREPRGAAHLRLPEIGAAGSERLARASIFVVGAGGIGCHALLHLAGAGVGRITLVDGDSVDASNLSRQPLYRHSDIGRNKAEAAADALRQLNPALRIQAEPQNLTPTSAAPLIRDCDLVLDTSDDPKLRRAVGELCFHNKRDLVSAALERFLGQLTTLRASVAPRRNPCYRCIFGDGGTKPGAEVASFGPLAGALGSLAAGEAIKVITGCGTPLTSRLLLLDALDGNTQTLSAPAQADCSLCAQP